MEAWLKNQMACWEMNNDLDREFTKRNCQAMQWISLTDKNEV